MNKKQKKQIAAYKAARTDKDQRMVMLDWMSPRRRELYLLCAYFDRVHPEMFPEYEAEFRYLAQPPWLETHMDGGYCIASNGTHKLLHQILHENFPELLAKARAIAECMV